MDNQQNGDRNKHAHDADQAREIPAVVVIDRKDMTVCRVIEGLAMGAPDHLRLANVPRIALEDIDHLAFHTIGLAREYLIKEVRAEGDSDWEPTVEDLTALFQECIFWVQFFATLLYQPTPNPSEHQSPTTLE